MLAKLKRMFTPAIIQRAGVVRLVKDWSNVTSFTPDIGVIESSERHFFFFYDEFKPNMRHYEQHLRTIAQPLAEAFSGGFYRMFVKGDGSIKEIVAFPADADEETPPWANPKGSPSARVKGHLVSVNKNTVYDLDTHRQNGVMYNRIRIWVRVPHQSVDHLIDGKFLVRPTTVRAFRAWMYIGNPEFWAGMIDNGYLTKPAPVFRDKTDTFYVNDYYNYRGDPL